MGIGRFCFMCYGWLYLILEHKGRAPIFLPFIADNIIPDSPEETLYKERKLKDVTKIDFKYRDMLE